MARMGFTRYLEAKRSVDDRALNRRVRERLGRELARLAPPIELADIGSGTGTGVTRLVDEGVVRPERTRITVVEPDPALAREAERRLGALDLPLELSRTDLEGFAATPAHRARFHLVVAHAVLDLLELEPAVERLVALARRGGLVYCPITFDGETIFEPAHEGDAKVLDAYHGTMKPTGDGKTGRRLYHAFSRQPVEVLELGSSDWVVHPMRGTYPGDEAYFLEFIVRTVESAVADRVEAELLEDWTASRLGQIARAELVFIAHQLDALARRSG